MAIPVTAAPHCLHSRNTMAGANHRLRPSTPESGGVLSQAAVPGAMLFRDELLSLAAQSAIHLNSASVYKRRFHFTLAACRAEYDQLLVNGAAVESVAIESVEPQAVLELQATLRLDDFENQSYPLALSRDLGITPLPRKDGSG